MIPTDVLHARCVGCSRGFEIPRDRLVALVREGRAHCQYCGGVLELPEEVRVALAAAPPAGSPGATPLKFPCPYCDRPSFSDSADGEKILRCAFCGGQFRSPAGNSSEARMIPVEGAVVRGDEVDRGIADLPDLGTFRVAREALRIRASRDELGWAESANLIANLSAVARWVPAGSDRAIIPLPLNECEGLIPVLIFGMTVSAVERTGRTTTLLLLLGETGSWSSGVTGTIAAAAVLTWVLVPDLGDLVLLPLALSGEAGEAAPRRYLRVTLRPRLEGTELTLASQIDTNPPKPNPKATAELARTLHEFKPVLEKYYALLALFGHGLGLTAARMSPARAIEARMRSLGGWLTQNAPSLAESLTLVCPRP